MHIRLGRPEDIPALRVIELAGDQQFVVAGHPEFDGDAAIPPDVAQESIDRGQLFVAELIVDGQPVVVGWLQLGRCGDECSIDQIAVSPEQQKQGIGRALMDLAFAEARTDGNTTIVLNTQSDIVWNQPWYQSLGFDVVPPDRWTEAMAAVSAAQSAAELDWSTRVHMRLSL